MKFKIGDNVFWVDAHTHYSKSIPCPMCHGKRVITLILGNGEHETSECGFCSHGVDRPSGFAKAWEPTAEVRAGVITGVSQRDGNRYEFNYETRYEHELFETREAAELACEVRRKEVKEQAEAHFRDSFIQAKKKQIWSNGYHKNCIAAAERSIEWHRLRLGMIAKKNATSESAGAGGEK